MNERKLVEDRIRKKRAEITGLEEKLKVARVYLTALSDILKLMEKGGEVEREETKLRAGSSVDQAREIILREMKPVHIDDLVAATGKSVNRDTKASLSGSLAAYVRNGEIFVRTAPATFGLIELGHAQEDEEQAATPPAGFGSFSDDLDEDIPF